MRTLSAVYPLMFPGEMHLRYDLFVASVGFESRAVYVAQQFLSEAGMSSALAFTDRQVLAFADNHAWFVRTGFTVDTVPEEQFGERVRLLLEDACGKRHSNVCRICVDISSMTRTRMACILAELMRNQGNVEWEADFLYAIPKWSPPSGVPQQTASAGAVHPFFAGWPTRPAVPNIALIGLGYEPDNAIGAYELLEAAGVWAFVPKGYDERYTESVRRANETLLTKLPDGKRIEYRVDQPLACFRDLEAIAYGVSCEARPVLLPFGPKIFALCSLLVGCLQRDVAVWRISPGQQGRPVERGAAGRIIGIRVSFSASEKWA